MKEMKIENLQEKSERKSPRRGLRSICAFGLALVLLITGSFAYFTDYATTQTSGTAGTVALSLDSGINLLNADGQDILNPGDQRDAGFTVTNEGNKSVDVRTTIALSAKDHEGNPIDFTGSASEQSEYDLYLRSDVEEIAGEGYKPKADAQPLQVKSITDNVITYDLPEYMLNGNSDKYDEVETIDGVNEFSHFHDLVFVMKGASGNEWQDSSVQIDIIVEAKQHENTQAGWDVVAKKEVTTGAITKDVVEEEIVITPLEGNESNEEQGEPIQITVLNYDGWFPELGQAPFANKTVLLYSVDEYPDFDPTDEYYTSQTPTYTLTTDENGVAILSSTDLANGSYYFFHENFSNDPIGEERKYDTIEIDGSSEYTITLYFHM